MLAPFAILFFPGSGFLAALGAFGLFLFRRKPWYFLLWLPIVLWSLIGTAAFISTLGYLREISHEPSDAATGFAGLGAMFVLGRTIFFVIAVVGCCIAYPRRDNFRRRFVLSSVALSAGLLIIIVSQMRSRVPVIVLDSAGHPIANVNISFDSGENLPGFRTQGTVKTDPEGKAMVHDYSHPRLAISVSSKDYYVPNAERYVVVDSRIVDSKPTEPVIFHLHKKGAGVALVTSKYGMAPDFSISIPRDGTPIKLDVMQRKIGDSGQIQISENKPAYAVWKQATSWSFRMHIPDGGFVEQAGEFPFEAPESGYQSVIEFDFQQGHTNWATDLKTNFYIKFGNPPRYGRLQVETGISYGGASINYAVNPKGSRNLEPAN
jgi:hypothetical protein